MLLEDDKATHHGWHFATIMYFQNDLFIRFRENIIACGRIKLYIRKNSIKKIKY